MSFDREAFRVQLHNLTVTCKNKHFGTQIGGSIGKAIHVNVEVDDTGWGNFLKVRIKVPLKKTLARGRFIIVKGKILWIPFKCEKIP